MRRLFPSIQTKKKRSEKNSVTKDTADIGTPNTIITTTTPNSNFLSSRSKHPKNKKKKKKSRYTSLGDSSIDSSIDSVEELPSYNYEDSIRTTRTCMANIDATPIQRNDKTTAIMSSSPKMNTAAATTVGMTTSNHVYVLSDEYSWIPARIVQVSSSSSKSDSTKVTVSVPIYKDEQAIQSDGGYQAIRQEERIIDLSKYPKHIQQLPLQNVNENGILQSVQDMVDLPFLHEVCFY